jgi:hypothetical protein
MPSKDPAGGEQAQVQFPHTNTEEKIVVENINVPG